MTAGALLVGMTLMAQTTVSGRLVDSESGEPLIGAKVTMKGETAGTVTDAEGNFSLKNSGKHRQITASYIGFKETSFHVNRSGIMGTLELRPNDIMLEGVTVTGTIGLDRKTPVALSNVTAEEIEEKLGTQEFPEILKTTPGVHANKQGGGWGDSEIYMRGFDNTNVATMINGVPMNDMEYGTV